MGLGQLMQTLTLAAQNSVPAKDIGVATSSTMFFRQMGGTLGVAVFVSILFNRLPDAIKEQFKSKDVQSGFGKATQEVMGKLASGQIKANDPNAVFLKNLASNPKGLGNSLNTDSSFLTGLDPRLARPFLAGFADSAVLVFESAAAVVAIAFVISWFMKAPVLRTKSAAEEKADAMAAAH
jgi:hypothetical protein